TIDGAAIRPALPVMECLRAAALCSDAPLIEVDGGFEVKGDPTEAALVVAAAKAGLDPVTLETRWPRIGELFHSERKRMTTLHQERSGVIACSKGAPEVIAPEGAPRTARWPWMRPPTMPSARPRRRWPPVSTEMTGWPARRKFRHLPGDVLKLGIAIRMLGSLRGSCGRSAGGKPRLPNSPTFTLEDGAVDLPPYLQENLSKRLRERLEQFVTEKGR
ncbi:MAG: hypothetical protein H0U97_01355, partial [Gammaproteobacteria bacterium]|nr:hypothetical protein [Gammaproteobacteria bacterium]